LIEQIVESSIESDTPIGVVEIEDKVKTKRFKRVTKVKIAGEFSTDLLAQLAKPTQNEGTWSEIFNTAAQNWNHQFFWKSLSAASDDELSSHTPLGKQLISDFGSVKQFISKFKEKGTTHFGSGWLWLALDPLTSSRKDQHKSKLYILTTHDADTPIAHNLIPLLAIDLWEHAYYLDYYNKKAEYLNNLIPKLVNWTFVQSNYKLALHSLASNGDFGEKLFSVETSDYAFKENATDGRENNSEALEEESPMDEQYILALYGSP